MANSLHDWLSDLHISQVECIVPDITGVARGKTLPKGQFILNSQIRMPETVLMQTVTGELPDNLPDADQELLLKPDPATLRPVPWAAEPTAQLIYDCFHLDGTEAELSPRNVLRRVLALYQAEGWQPVVASEMEFYLVAPNRDADTPLAPPVGRTGRAEFGPSSYAVDATNEFDPLFEDLYDFSEAQGLEVETLVHEVGSAQMGINFRHGDALQLADQVFLFKRTAREAAFLHDTFATFMAKPMEEEPGSAMHIHQSVIDRDTGCNVFTRKDGSPSTRFYHYLGGLQTYLPQVMPFLAPYVNSYRRLVRHASAPVNVQWGYDNRTVALRVPHSGSQDRRIENRVAGVDVNPYLALAATLACGYLGMTRRLPCSEPWNGTANELPYQLPRNALVALEKLAACRELSALLGQRFCDAYIEMKMNEMMAYFQVISPWERRYLLLQV